MQGLGYPLTDDLDLQQHGPRDLKASNGRSQIKREKKTEEVKGRKGKRRRGALGAVYRGSIHKVGKVAWKPLLSTVGDTVESPSHRTSSQNVTRHTE